MTAEGKEEGITSMDRIAFCLALLCIGFSNGYLHFWIEEGGWLDFACLLYFAAFRLVTSTVGSSYCVGMTFVWSALARIPSRRGARYCRGQMSRPLTVTGPGFLLFRAFSESPSSMRTAASVIVVTKIDGCLCGQEDVLRDSLMQNKILSCGSQGAGDVPSIDESRDAAKFAVLVTFPLLTHSKSSLTICSLRESNEPCHAISHLHAASRRGNAMCYVRWG